MAKVKQMEFKKEVKISHNYNSISVSYGITVELDENDVTEEVKEMGWATVNTELDKRVAETIKTFDEI